MGCIQSSPRNKRRGSGDFQGPQAGEARPVLRRSSHEPTKVQDIQFPQVARHEAVATPIEPIFLDAEEFAVSERSGSLPLSPRAMLISSAIAENASSHLNQSSEGSGRPSSPDFIVSPNPMSPAGAAIPAPATRNVGFASISNGQESSPVSPRDFKTAFATPVSAVPESSNTSSLTSNRQLDRSGASLYPSRLADVAELRNDKLCIQIFSFWRSQVMKDKIDNLRGQLTAAGRASELILAENAKLKARVAELEHAITVVHSAPEVESHTVSTGSEDLSMSMPHQLPPSSFESPRPSQTAINFVTPPSHTSPLRHSGFVSPLSAQASPMRPSPINIATPTTLTNIPEPRRNWEEYLRPSSELRLPFPAQPDSLLGRPSWPAPVSMPVQPTSLSVAKENVPDIGSLSSPSPAFSKDKLKAISADLQKLSDSLASVDLKRRPIERSEFN